MTQNPFIFKTQMSLVMMTGLKARNLSELFECLKAVPESSVYFHTHHFLQQHQFLVPEPPNDFASWVASAIQDEALGEQLASIDTIRYASLSALRQAILEVLESYLKSTTALRQAPRGEEFHFMRCVLFSLPTGHVAEDLAQFRDGLMQVSMGCLYNHIFVARLRPPIGRNDFSYWLVNELKETRLAEFIDKLDPYTHTMEGLRKRILQLVERRLGESTHG